MSVYFQGKMDRTLHKYYELYIPEKLHPYIKPSIYAILLVSGSAILFSLFNRVRMHLKVKAAMNEARCKRTEQLKSLRQRLENSSVSI